MRVGLLLGASLVFAFPVTAGAEPAGHAACSVIIPSKNRLIYTDPLPASEADLAGMTAAFAKAMQERIYRDELDIQMIGDCHLEPTSAKAEAYMEVIKRGVTAKGMTTFWMRYTPKAN